MIPASYLFRDVYRAHFEEDLSAAPVEPEGPRGGEPFGLSGIANAALLFALAPFIGAPAREAHARRR